MSNRIKEVIKEQGYTINALADKMGMSRENLSKRLANPSTPTLEKLSDALNVPVWQLFASPEEVRKLVCPHCGKEIKIKIE